MKTHLRYSLVLASLSLFSGLANAAMFTQEISFAAEVESTPDDGPYAITYDQSRDYNVLIFPFFGLGSLDRVIINIEYDAVAYAKAKFVDYGFLTAISGTATIAQFDTSVSVGGQGTNTSNPTREECLDALPTKDNSCSAEANVDKFYELNNAYVRSSEMGSFLDGTARLNVSLDFDAGLYSGIAGLDRHEIEDAAFFARIEGVVQITYQYTPTPPPSPVPVPAAAWLFGSALLSLGFIKRKNK